MTPYNPTKDPSILDTPSNRINMFREFVIDFVNPELTPIKALEALEAKIQQANKPLDRELHKDIIAKNNALLSNAKLLNEKRNPFTGKINDMTLEFNDDVLFVFKSTLSPAHDITVQKDFKHLVKAIEESLKSAYINETKSETVKENLSKSESIIFEAEHLANGVKPLAVELISQHEFSHASSVGQKMSSYSISLRDNKVNEYHLTQVKSLQERIISSPHFCSVDELPVTKMEEMDAVRQIIKGKKFSDLPHRLKSGISPDMEKICLSYLRGAHNNTNVEQIKSFASEALYRAYENCKIDDLKGREYLIHAEAKFLVGDGSQHSAVRPTLPETKEHASMMISNSFRNHVIGSAFAQMEVYVKLNGIDTGADIKNRLAETVKIHEAKQGNEKSNRTAEMLKEALSQKTKGPGAGGLSIN